MTAILDRVVVTGASGRLGTALLAELSTHRRSVAIPWRRPEYELDSTDPRPLLERDKPSLVIHAAAWTDVDGCALEPELALLRNGSAVGSLAVACSQFAIPLVAISTNEVFDGSRMDGHGYVETDSPSPVNAYGASKLAGETAARGAFGNGVGLWVVRTGWLYGPPGNDFPEKIIAAADRLAPNESLSVVTDETGSPTFARDLAKAILQLVQATDGGLFHLMNRGYATRYQWADAVLGSCRPGRQISGITRNQYGRVSTPPSWAVLDCSRANSAGVSMPEWRASLAAYLAKLCATLPSDGSVAV